MSFQVFSQKMPCFACFKQFFKPYLQAGVKSVAAISNAILMHNIIQM
jgi:hypothetical protein